MTKDEAIHKMVDDFSPIPQNWVQIVAESLDEYPRLPMWGTMFIVDDFYGRRLMENSRVMKECAEEVDDCLSDYSEAEQKKIKPLLKALKKENISWGESVDLEDFIDEEMSGEHCILDDNGSTTAAFIYELDGQYLIGINGAGWDFYSGVWDNIYDVCGLKWHDEVA